MQSKSFRRRKFVRSGKKKDLHPTGCKPFKLSVLAVPETAFHVHSAVGEERHALGMPSIHAICPYDTTFPHGIFSTIEYTCSLNDVILLLFPLA